MPEMMGVVLWVDMLMKNGRRPHEFEELQHRRPLPGNLTTALQLLRVRWMR